MCRNEDSLLGELVNNIVSNLKVDGSFLMKSIEIEFHGFLGIESFLRDL